MRSILLLLVVCVVIFCTVEVSAQPCKGSKKFFFLEQHSSLDSNNQMKAWCPADTTILASGISCNVCRDYRYINPANTVPLTHSCVKWNCDSQCNCNAPTSQSFTLCYQALSSTGAAVSSGAINVNDASTSLTECPFVPGANAVQQCAGMNTLSGALLLGSDAHTCTGPTDIDCWETEATEDANTSLLTMSNRSKLGSSKSPSSRRASKTPASIRKPKQPRTKKSKNSKSKVKSVPHCALSKSGTQRCGTFRCNSSHPIAKLHAHLKTKVGKGKGKVKKTAGQGKHKVKSKAEYAAMARKSKAAAAAATQQGNLATAFDHSENAKKFQKLAN